MADHKTDLRFTLREIKTDDVVSKFSLGIKDTQPLKTFLQKDARRFHKSHIAKTYVLVKEEPVVVGYATLISSEIKHEKTIIMEDCEDAEKYSTYPAVKIARFAIHKDYQGIGLGSLLLDWCISLIVTNIVPIVGCRFVVIDAKQNAKPFYLKKGFTILNTVENRKSKMPIMFIDLHKLVRNRKR